ncbi:MAG: M56 family metallopeptidase [Cellvibrio sp.]|uniref:M56 family metallopeptidase n=1 Tax=Cellvibrio sp. TaxID=1965322 RepID=UPI0031AE63AA
MPITAHFLQQDWINSLGWALLHSLWQHALIATCCALLLFFNKYGSANSRYLIALGGILVATFTSALTFYNYQQASTEIILRPLQNHTLKPLINSPEVLDILDIINAHMDSIALMWLTGVIVYGMKILCAYKSCQQLKNQSLTATPVKWQHIFAQLATKIGITNKIELRISLVATIPCVIGHVKPVVLLPMKLLLGMDQQQIEAILLHELAHIRRQDYLLGIIQTLIKAIFFFNPFLLWIASQMDKEREHACDDIAVAVNQNPLLFANTLKELAEMNIDQKMTMNITGKKLLLNRITRLFNKHEKKTTPKHNIAASITILFTSLVLAICVNAAPDKGDDKKISIDVADTAVSEVLKEVNKKCGTSETLATNNDGKMTLLLDEISCSQAIQLLKDFAAEKPVQ